MFWVHRVRHVGVTCEQYRIIGIFGLKHAGEESPCPAGYRASQRDVLFRLTPLFPDPARTSRDVLHAGADAPQLRSPVDRIADHGIWPLHSMHYHTTTATISDVRFGDHDRPVSDGCHTATRSDILFFVLHAVRAALGAGND